MKTPLYILGLGAILTMASCGNSENTPEAVTKEFCKAMANKDIDRAVEFCTEKSATLLKANKLMNLFTSDKKLSKEEVDCIKKGDRAKCTFCCVEGENSNTYTVVQENGAWKVDYSVMDMSTGDVLEGIGNIKEAVEAGMEMLPQQEDNGENDEASPEEEPKQE